MWLWMIVFLVFLLALRDLRRFSQEFGVLLGQGRGVLALKAANAHLKLLQECLESGVVPEVGLWEQIQQFPEPWGLSLSRSLTELRAQGAPVLPSLLRMQNTLEEQTEMIQEARVKSSQAVGQAFMGFILIPLFGGVLDQMLPGIAEHQGAFCFLLFFCMLFCSGSLVWIFVLVDQARFGNLRSENRSWMVSVNSTIERVFALISCGMPPDLAWKKSIEELALLDSKLASVWKSEIWDADFSLPRGRYSDCEKRVLQVGIEMRKSIQVSLIEGRTCLDRLEAIQRGFFIDFKASLNRELALLPNRCLKPLFVFVLPSVLCLMFGSFAMVAEGFLSR